MSTVNQLTAAEAAMWWGVQKVNHKFINLRLCFFTLRICALALLFFGISLVMMNYWLELCCARLQSISNLFVFFEKWFKKEKCQSLNMASTSCDISSFFYLFLLLRREMQWGIEKIRWEISYIMMTIEKRSIFGLFTEILTFKKFPKLRTFFSIFFY